MLVNLDCIVQQIMDDLQASGLLAIMETQFNHTAMTPEEQSGYAYQALACGENWRKQGNQKVSISTHITRQPGLEQSSSEHTPKS